MYKWPEHAAICWIIRCKIAHGGSNFKHPKEKRIHDRSFATSITSYLIFSAKYIIVDVGMLHAIESAQPVAEPGLWVRGAEIQRVKRELTQPADKLRDKQCVCVS